MLLPATCIGLLACAYPEHYAYTTERLGLAANAQSWLVSSRQLIRPDGVDPASSAQPTTDSSIQLALASFLNITACTPRWNALVNKLVQKNDLSAAPSSEPFGAPYEYKLIGLGKKTKVQRGFVDAISIRLNPGDLPHDVHGVKNLFAHFRPTIKKGPGQIGAWTNGIHWWARLLLPPLVAEHFAGVLDDQCASGPWVQRLTGKAAAIAPTLRLRKSPEDLSNLDIIPRVDFTDDSQVPMGWSADLKYRNQDVLNWLRSFLLNEVGPKSADACELLSNEQLGLLNAALTSATAQCPGKYRPGIQEIIKKIRSKLDLEHDPDEIGADIGVDRQVVDWDTFAKIRTALDRQCITGREPARQQRLRLLVVMAFRFGMRRQEILGLRRIDVDLQGTGRIHIRPYTNHPLKTGFSARSLPITVLLPPDEQAMLAHACMGLEAMATLFLIGEHRTLPDDAIKLIRSVSGDSSLKLHHLRHSFASLLTLKVVLARHPEWLGAFAPWPHATQALQDSPNLIGTLIKPQSAAADFLVVPRLLGHSSYEVTLTHYAHTLETVGALYQAHVMSPLILPDRELCLLIHKRFDAAKKIRDDAMVWPQVSNNSIQDTASPQAQTTRADRFEELLRSWMARCRAGEQEHTVIPKGIDLAEVSNWFTPRQASDLPAKLRLATNRLTQDEVNRLIELGKTYWQKVPPMFWFSQARYIANQVPGRTVVDDALSFIGLMCNNGFEKQDMVLWRYANADASAHKAYWKKVLETLGLSQASNLRSGRATTVQCLGITFASKGKALRSQLPGVWWRALESELHSLVLN